MTNESDSSSIKKIVYFDEGSAIDYLDITNDGLKIITEEGQTGSSTSGKINAKGGVGTGIALKALSPFIKFEADGQAKTEITRFGESIVRTTISNTVLSDFIINAHEDKSIKIIRGFRVEAHPESISFLKMYTPYFSMINKDDEAINISRVDDVLEKGKGYYELIADNETEQKVLRFNIKAFRNNYSLVDLTKMDLEFYAIEVGKMSIEDLNAKKEFSLLGNNTIVSPDEILSSSKEEDSPEKNNESIVYDVILAGIR